MRRLLHHLRHVTALAVVTVLIGSVLLVGWNWLNPVKALSFARLGARHLAIGVLETFLAVYFLVLGTASLAMAILGWLAWQLAWRGKVSQWLLLSSGIVFGLIALEAAAAWLSWRDTQPALPRHFAAKESVSEDIRIYVIGESSALGVPYEDWLSIGEIIASELHKAIPVHRFRVDVLAEKGATLEVMCRKLSRLTERPDALVVYCGHNEFLARFSLLNRVSYYFDEMSISSSANCFEGVGRYSPLYTLVRQNLEKQRVSVIPSRSVGQAETVVGRPVCTPEEANAVVGNFQHGLEKIVTACQQVGCLPILIIPPGNDAFEPSQSHATPWTGAAARRALFHRLIEIRGIEKQNAAQAIMAYREVILQQPTHADTHWRLARLLESAGSFTEANRHYILARDHDGLPLRLSTVLETTYRAVARRHVQRVVLVDGPAVLRAKSQHGILDYRLFHDNVHPTLAGHVALAEAVLTGLKARAAFGWPACTPAPLLDARRCAQQFGIDSVAWAMVCERSAVFYDQLAFLATDSSERLKWRDRYAKAASQIRAGSQPEDVGISGVGVEHQDKPPLRTGPFPDR